MPAFINPYMNPYQQMPYGQQNPYAAQQPAPNPYQQNPYQPAPNPYQPNPYQPAPEQFQQPPYQPAPAQPYVNPYKPVRPAPQPKPEPAPAPAPAYKAVPDDQWVNPFAPKREKAPEPQPEPTPVGGDAPAGNVIARTSEEVMAMVEDTVEKSPAEPEESAVTAPAEEPVEETAPEAAEETAEEAPQPEKPAQDEYVSPFDDPMGGEDENTLTEYVPPVHEKKERKPDNMVKPEMDTDGMTSYDPNFYRKRAEERKQRIAEAAGEAKHKEEEKAAEPEYIDCKGPLEFTGEHPWAWKCTRCGQIFQKHEIPHKCIKTD